MLVLIQQPRPAGHLRILDGGRAQDDPQRRP